MAYFFGPPYTLLAVVEVTDIRIPSAIFDASLPAGAFVQARCRPLLRTSLPQWKRRMSLGGFVFALKRRLPSLRCFKSFRRSSISPIRRLGCSCYCQFSLQSGRQCRRFAAERFNKWAWLVAMFTNKWLSVAKIAAEKFAP